MPHKTWELKSLKRASLSIYQLMRITVELEEELLEAIIAATGETKKSPAIVKALRELLRRRTLQDFSQSILRGEFDFEVTNEELEEHDITA